MFRSQCFRIVPSDVPWVVFKNFITESRHVDMCIDNGGGYTLMTKHCLDGPEVGTALKEGCGEGVAEGVRRDGLLYAGIAGVLLHHNQNHRSGEMMAAAVQEDIVLLAGLYVLHGVTVDEPQVELTYGGIGDRHQPLLGALTGDTDELLVEEEVGELQVDELGDTQAAGEEHFNDGLVAPSLPLLEIDGVLYHVNLLRREHLRQVLAQIGTLKEFRGVFVKVTVEHQVAVEGTYAAQYPRLRLWADAHIHECGDKVLQVLKLDVDNMQGGAMEIAEQMSMSCM